MTDSQEHIPPKQVTPSFGEFDTLGEPLLRAFNRTQPPLEQALFHYTNLDAFRLILESGSLWATHIAYLNDSSELAYAHNLLASITGKFIPQENAPLARDFLERIAREADPFASASEYYVTCFCQDGDLLSQWRGYGGRGGGCAIGFVPAEINGGTAPAVVLGQNVYWLQGWLRKVVYDLQLQEKAVEELVFTTLGLLKARAACAQGSELERLLSNAVGFARQHLTNFYLVFKNPAFREENEWRAIFPFNRDSHQEANAFLKFRASSDRLVPYIPVQLGLKSGDRQGKLPVGSVVLGPGLVSSLGEASVRRFLVNVGYANVQIVRSVVPLR